jgi:UDPglucose 6-dehydrogenase
VQAYDPEALKVARGIFGGKITYTTKNYDALKGADALAVITEWQEFREPDFARMKKLMRSPVVFDGRNIYQPESMKSLGFTYYSIGRT